MPLETGDMFRFTSLVRVKQALKVFTSAFIAREAETLRCGRDVLDLAWKLCHVVPSLRLFLSVSLHFHLSRKNADVSPKKPQAGPQLNVRFDAGT